MTLSSVQGIALSLVEAVSSRLDSYDQPISVVTSGTTARVTLAPESMTSIRFAR